MTWNSSGQFTFNQGATFNSYVDIYSSLNLVGGISYLTINRSNTANDGVIIFKDAGVNKWILGARGESTNNFYLYSYGTSGHPLVVNYSTGAVTFSSTITSPNIQIGDYTGNPTLTFAAANGGANRINFYDQNTTEGTYLRTIAENAGGTMYLGARWDDDEDKIALKMYQVSAGGPYNVRVGVDTTSPFSTFHVGTRPGAGATNPSLGSIATISNDGLTGIDLGGNVNANNVVGHINWVNYLGVGNYNTARIDVYADGAGNSGSLRFWTASVSSSPTIRLTIASTGDATFASNVGVGTSPIGRLTAKYTSYASNQTPLYIGNTGFTAWNRQAYDTFVLQQDDVTSFRMVEKNGEATTNDQVLSFSIGDGNARIATSAQPLDFYVNGSPSGLAYQGLSGTAVLRMNTNGNAQFYQSLDVSGTVSTGGNFLATSGGIAEIRLRGGGYGTSYNTSLRSIVGAPGVLQMGNNGPNYILAGNTVAGGLLEFRVNCNSESVTSGSKVLTLNANATANFESTLTAGGDIVAYSDRRLKTNVQPIKNALDKTLSLQGITYNRTDADADKSTKIGFIAQDVLDVLPEVVTHDLNSDIYGVSYGNVTALLVEAVKELSEQNKKLEEKNREFETILSSLINKEK